MIDPERLQAFYKVALDILNYWIDECPEFKESILLFGEFLKDIENDISNDVMKEK